MGTFRFNRRIKTGPNTYMNIGKNGVSTSIRAGGMTFTSGKNGSYVTTGIPGTGMSYRQKIGGGSSNGQRPKKGNQHSLGGLTGISIFVGIIIGIIYFLKVAKPTTILMIAIAVIGFLSALCLIFWLWKKLVTIPRAKRTLAEALEEEEGEIILEIERIVSSVKSQMDTESDPYKKKAYEAFVTNYPYVRFTSVP